MLLVVPGFESIEWDRLIAETKLHTRSVVNGEPNPVLLVEGTMVLNYRYSSYCCLFYHNDAVYAYHYLLGRSTPEL